MCDSQCDIYYYAAVDKEGKITTDAIIDGLEWMLKNSVKKVNLSISSKIASKDLETWIKNHEEIQVFASYNNEYNTSDYPAMYEKLVGGGNNAKVSYKDIDKKYMSSKILVINDKVTYYEGNSYLSVLTMLDY